MKLEEVVAKRSNNTCELCSSANGVAIYDVLPHTGKDENNCIMICDKCRSQIEKKEELDSKHWDCLTTSMWSEVPGVQVMAWRMLNRLKDQSWAAENLDIMYLDDDMLTWAKASGDHIEGAASALHKDAYGNVLVTGDTVLLTQSLPVKGAAVNAKIGTVVKNIHLDDDNTGQIEGRIDGQVIVILTKYVKKQIS